jgi:hypothetical protein
VVAVQVAQVIARLHGDAHPIIPSKL